MRWMFSTLICIVLFSCGNNNNQDVSAVQLNITTQRFDKDFFSIDTNNILPQLENTIRKYPSFGNNFLSTILNTDSGWSTDARVDYIKSFMTAYKQVYDTAQVVFADFSLYEKEIVRGLKYVKYYFPDYPIPSKIITYIGPLDGYGDILTEDAIIVALHHHLGSTFSLYKSNYVRDTYPEYLTRRFEPDYIAINCMRNIIDDMFPLKFEEKSMLIQMVEQGKRLYLLSKFLPDNKPNQIIGYTEKQMKACLENENIIWDLFVQNNFLQNTDHNLIVNYIGESPKTKELGDEAPGNIGSFAGWQIVKKYMKENTGTSLLQLMNMEAESLFNKAKYKP